jgi:CMP-N,N'-diacetyllegionaminic acid synthase
VKTLAIVPARAGSKGIPHKNTRSFRGVPLVGLAIEIGMATCGQTMVSTDDPNVAVIAKSYGATVIMRPETLATDEAPMLGVIQHALQLSRDQSDVIVLLQPTSPLRTRGHVRAALRLIEETGADSVASVVEIPAHLSPDYAVAYDGTQLWPFDSWTSTLDEMVKRRQDAQAAYYRDGTVYAIRRQTIEGGQFYGERCAPLIIPAHTSATLDTEEDWMTAEAKAHA